MILLVFFTAFKFMNFKFNPSDLEKISIEGREIVTLENYLRSTVSVDGANISMADLIRAFAADSKYKGQLSKATADFFSGHNNFEIDMPSIEFYYPEKVIPSGYNAYAIPVTTNFKSISISIPSKKGIEVILYTT